MFKSILVLCIGNICRSPLALVRLELALKGSNITVNSAGIGAMVDYPAHDTSKILAKNAGLDLSGHKAKQVTQKIIGESDLILVMTENQKRTVHQEFPQSRGKVFLLYKEPATDIPDPFNKNMADFEKADTLIAAGVDQWASILI